MTITESLQGKSILITGSTGFLGKPVVEKILREVPDVRQIYVLIRPKTRPSGEVLAAADRMEGELIGSDVFDKLRAARPDFDTFIHEKLSAVGGDVSLEGLDLIPEDAERLFQEIDIIINSAAVVVFDERLDFAVQLNTLGPGRLLDFAKKCRKTPLFIHVSTAYVNGKRVGRVPELLFEPGKSIAHELNDGDAPEFDIEKEVEYAVERGHEVENEARRTEMSKRFHRAAVRELGPRFLPGSSKVKAQAEVEKEKFVRKRLVKAGMARAKHHGWHDTYTFTKALGEQFLVREAGEVPISIIRPSIIESALAEPSPGWIDGFRMADPLISAFGKGRLKDFPGDPDATLDLVPVDCVVGALLASIPYLAEHKGVQLFQVATGSQNPVAIKEVVDHVVAYFTRNPMRNKKGEAIAVKPWTYPSPGRFEFDNRYRIQLPLAIAEFSARHLPGLRKYYNRVAIRRTAAEHLRYYAELYGPYVQYACQFGTDNTARLLGTLSDEERERFDFDVRRVDWFQYFNDIHIPGLKRHVLKMDTVDDETPEKRGAPKSSSGSTKELLSGIGTIQDLYIHSAVRFANKTACQVKRDGAWQRFTFSQVREHLRQHRTSLAREGLKKGDRILLLSENQPEWGLSYLGATSLGLIVVPLDRQTRGDEILRVADFVEAGHLLVSPACHKVLQGQVGDDLQKLTCLNVNNFALKMGETDRTELPYAQEELAPRVPVEPDDLASIIFTSGTTVDPKGVMLTHANFIANVGAVAEVLAPYETDQFLSVLPMNHALEFTGGLLMPIFGGACVTYVSALKSKVILDTMQETGTTCLIGVPRLFKLFHDGITKEIEKAGKFTSGVVGALKTVSQASQAVSGVNSGRRLFAKVHEKFGGRVRVFVSGGAALDPEIFEDFQQMGFPVCEGYGLTETAPVLTVNPLEGPKRSSVGPPVPNIELRLDNQDATGVGEIVARGPSIMKGYYRNEEATQAVLKDGWLHTGDLGRLDDDGYLYITGRVKDLIVTAAGKNVYPDEVEQIYRDLPNVKEMTVIGVRNEGTVGEEVHLVIVLDSVDDAAAAQAEVRKEIQRISRDVATYQRIQKVHFSEEELPKTATLKVKRNQVRQSILEEEAPAGKPAPEDAASPDEAGSLEEGVKQLLSEISRTPRHEVQDDKDLQYDLGMDSLTKVEFLAAADNRFAVRLPESVVSHLHVVQDAVETVRKAVEDEEGSAEPESDKHESAAVNWSSIIKSGDVPDEELRAAGRGAVSRFTRGLLLRGIRRFCRSYLSVQCRGKENLPRSGPFVIASNHSSHLDSLAILASAPELYDKLRILGARDYFFNYRLKGWFFRNYLNVLPFDRQQNFLEGLRVARACIENDYCLLIFPEGTRSPGGEIQPFKVGLGIIAFELGVPIVPVRIQGAYDSLPKGRAIPRRERITVTFGKPIEMEEFSAPEPGPARFHLYKEIVDTSRERVLEMDDEDDEALLG